MEKKNFYLLKRLYRLAHPANGGKLLTCFYPCEGPMNDATLILQVGGLPKRSAAELSKQIVLKTVAVNFPAKEKS